MTGETGKSQFFRSDGLRLKSMNIGGVDGSHGIKEKLDSTGDFRILLESVKRIRVVEKIIVGVII